MTIDSGAEESVWPISLLKKIPTLKIVGKKKRFAAANGQDSHHGRKEVKFGDTGDAKMLSFEVTDVPKPVVAVRRIIEKRTRYTSGRKLHPECEKRQDSNEEERRVLRDRHRGQRRRERSCAFQRAGLRSSEHSFGSETGE